MRYLFFFYMYLIQAEVPGAGRGKKRIVNINNYDFFKAYVIFRVSMGFLKKCP